MSDLFEILHYIIKVEIAHQSVKLPVFLIVFLQLILNRFI